MSKQAIDIMENMRKHVLIMGDTDTGTGKYSLVNSLLSSNSDCKYYNFSEINSGENYQELRDENFDNYDFLESPEKTLILDGVFIGEDFGRSKVVQFIKKARKYGKRLIVITSNVGGERIKPLFGAVISLSNNVTYTVETLS